jgi:hypothetical protein
MMSEGRVGGLGQKVLFVAVGRRQKVTPANHYTKVLRTFVLPISSKSLKTQKKYYCCQIKAVILKFM